MTSSVEQPEPFAAIVLAGGAGARLGGVDKAALDVAGTTLLDRALAAVSHAARIVVVGPPRALAADVIGTQEDPPGSGPVAAVAAGLAALDATPRQPEQAANDLVVVLACDMPLVDAAAVGRLIEAARSAPGVDGAAYVDSDGRRQHLAAAYGAPALRTALESLGQLDGAAMRHLVELLTIVEIRADPETTLDCDTWPDVRRTRTLVEQRVEER